MAIPIGKMPGIKRPLENLVKGMYTRQDSIRKDICVACGGVATKFNDEISQKEYTISGLCQECQDEVFKPPVDPIGDLGGFE